MSSNQRPQVVILIPVFNDWDCVALLLPLLDDALRDSPCEFRIVLIDDGSTRVVPPALSGRAYRHLDKVDVLHLSRNIGHQRAIAIGLYHIYMHLPCSKVLVMDADGQDLPEQVQTLLTASERHPGEVIFAARTKRLETVAFRICYGLYRLSHRILTGIPVRVGNFSVLPWNALARLMVVSDLWSHYAAAVFRARLEYRTVPLPRGPRLAGNSRMNFSALLVHGLSAICVFGDIVSARVLATAVIVTLVTLVGALAAACSRWAGCPIPAWIWYGLAGLGFMAFQSVLLSTVLALTIMASRSHMSFIPIRDGGYFIRGVTALSPTLGSVASQPRQQVVVRA